MKRLIAAIGSKPCTLAGFLALGVCVLALQLVVVHREVGPWLVALPLGFLALNLAAALISLPALRRGGLGLFHVGLLSLMLLAGWGRLTHLNGRVEMVEGGAFDATQVEVLSRGPWHRDRLADLHWQQGPLEVRYAPGLKRERTRSEVTVAAAADETPGPRVVGDDVPLRLQGYRFYTTHNKGYAPVLAWVPRGGAALAGAVHMPSYPLLDWQQANEWTLPDGTSARLSLAVKDGLAVEGAWSLRSQVDQAVLTLRIGTRQWDLRPGDAVPVGDAQLRFERVGLWMGYLVYYDPTLLPMLVAALLAICGMAWHLWGRLGRLPLAPALPAAAATGAAAGSGPVAPASAPASVPPLAGGVALGRQAPRREWP